MCFRSTEDEFNPRAAQQKFLSHSLIDLLNQVCIIVLLFGLGFFFCSLEAFTCTFDLSRSDACKCR